MDIFYGRVTDAMAHVYVREARTDPDDARSLSGWIRGPHCALSHTLPATIALRDMGKGPTLLGAAAVPDPCFWSTQLPALYDVHVELRDGAIDEIATGIAVSGAIDLGYADEGQQFVVARAIVEAVGRLE